MYLGITLNKLDDFESSKQAFEKAISLENTDCTIFLNYAIILANNGMHEEAKIQFNEAEQIFKTLDEDDKEPEMLD